MVMPLQQLKEVDEFGFLAAVMNTTNQPTNQPVDQVGLESDERCNGRLLAVVSSPLSCKIQSTALHYIL